MFSSRTNWQRQRNQLAALVDNIRNRGDRFIDLTISNPTEAGIDYPAREIIRALSDDRILRYEPHPKGSITAREAVASYYARKNVALHPDHIILTASTSEAYAMVFKLLCDAGDEVLVPVPTYPLFEFLAQLNDVVATPYRLRYDGEWHIDVDLVRRSLSRRTRAIIIINPHNPTGMFLKKAELEALSAIASSNGLALIVDEVFADYRFGNDPARVVSTADTTDVLSFTLNGISKLAGLPQMKLGWIAVSGPPEQEREALERLEIIADTYLSVNTPVQVALPVLFQHGENTRTSIARRVSGNMATLRRLVSPQSQCTVLNSEGGWYGIVRVPRTRTDEEWAIGLLKDVSVYVHPGYFFEFEDDNVLVLCLLAPPDQCEEGVKRIVGYVSTKS